MALAVTQNHATAIDLLQSCVNQYGACVYRPEVLQCCISALRAAGGEGGFLSVAIQDRELNLHLGRPLGKRAVGSTLLLKVNRPGFCGVFLV